MTIKEITEREYFAMGVAQYKYQQNNDHDFDNYTKQTKTIEQQVAEIDIELKEKYEKLQQICREEAELLVKRQQISEELLQQFQ